MILAAISAWVAASIFTLVWFHAMARRNERKFPEPKKP